MDVEGGQEVRTQGGTLIFSYIRRLGPFLCVCLFDSLRPINNLSSIKGRIFLGSTSTKLGLMFLLKDTTQ